MVSGAIGLLLLTASADAPVQPVDAAEVRRTIERSLPFLENVGVGWNRNYSCLMCHHQPMLIWAHNEARARGIPVDEKKLRDWTNRTWSKFLAPAAFRLTEADEKNLIGNGVPADVVARVKSLQREIGFQTEEAFLAAVAKLLAPDELARYRGVLLQRGRRLVFLLTDEGEKSLAVDGVPAPVLAKLRNLPFTVTEADFVAAVGKLVSPDELGQHRAALLKSARHDFSLTIRGKHIIEDEKLANEVPFAVMAKLVPLRVPSGWGGREVWTDDEFVTSATRVLSAAEWDRYGAALVKHARKPEQHDGALESKAWLLLGRLTDTDPERQAALTAVAALLAQTQEPAGTWVAWWGGQQRNPGQWRPVATMWAVLALDSLRDNPEAVRTRDRALEWIKKQPWFENQLQIADWQDYGEWNEPLFLHSLLAQKFGAAKLFERLFGEMLSRQNADGGWSSWKGNKSDAYGTGQALYVLSVMGRDSADPVVRRAQKYLLERQQPDGSWGFAGGGAPPSYWRNNPPRTATLDDVRGYWCTAWAVIGLARTMPRRADGP